MSATKTKEKSIRLRDWDVRAVLAGTKSQMRVPVKPQPKEQPMLLGTKTPWWTDGFSFKKVCPFGVIGDRLWVKEAWRAYEPTPQRLGGKGVMGGMQVRVYANPPIEGESVVEYRADADLSKCFITWLSSTTLPRWASRLTLEITEIRVERAGSISAKDIIAEGCVLRSHDDRLLGKSPIGSIDGACYVDLRSLWAATFASKYGKESIAANPWVWILSFRRVENLT